MKIRLLFTILCAAMLATATLHADHSDDPAHDLAGDPAEEIARDQKPLKQKIEQINRYNPFYNNSDFQKFFQQAQAGGAGIPAQLNRGLQIITQDPHRALLLYVEIGWALAMMTLRVWMYSRSKSWMQRFLHGIVHTFFYWSFALFLIPWLTIGEPYLAYWRALLS